MPIQDWNHDAEPSPEKYDLIVGAGWLDFSIESTLSEGLFVRVWRKHLAGTPIQLKEGRTIGGAYIPANALGEIVEVIHAGYVVAFHLEGKRISFTAKVDEITGVHRG